MAFEFTSGPTAKDQTALGFSVEWQFSSPGDQAAMCYYGIWHKSAPPPDEAAIMAGTGAVSGSAGSGTYAANTLHTVVSGEILSLLHEYKYHILAVNPDLP